MESVDASTTSAAKLDISLKERAAKMASVAPPKSKVCGESNP